MRVLVCGSRKAANEMAVWQALDFVRALLPSTTIPGAGDITEVIVGDATGIDAYAQSWAIERGVQARQFRAAWDKLGRAAGPLRNQRMIEARPDVVLAFPGGRGTGDMTRRARLAGVPVIDVTITEGAFGHGGADQAIAA
jgi:hypothetical protein